MFKIIKTKIEASLKPNSEIGLNENFRTTMGYNSADKTISVLVESVNRPDLTRDEEAPLTYTEVASRIFGIQDFPQTTDCVAWFTVYDVEANKISDPIVVWDWVATLKNPTIPEAGKPYTVGSLQTDLLSYFSPKVLPLFHLGNFHRLVPNFDGALLQFFVTNTDETTLRGSDTVLLNPNLEVMTTLEKNLWNSYNALPQITFDVLDIDGNVVNVQQTQEMSTRHKKVTLPKADDYFVKINFAKPEFETVSNTYDVTIVNGGINKNRIVISEGSSIVTINARGLNSGDFVKLKLNVGKFVSFAEFWITIQ